MSQLIDHSPPNGDYVRYLEKLMQPSGVAMHASPSVTAGANHVSSASTPVAVPGAEGPPDLVELLNKLIKKPKLRAEGKGTATWWLWVAMALVIAGVLFPVAMGSVAVVAFVLWRAVKSLSGTRIKIRRKL
ncbi:hypothetical protein [Ottowia thiooxydans]|uniref:hypothetical protein n=1 Tax=Ottowia thiooxydans TaxID=219182 RepID=UPI0003FFEF6B|nr:hypothetical protein [Ottowia thiooxydans]